MPLPGPASTSPDPAVDPEPQHGEHVSGWAAIEHHLYKHDGGEMKYYAEDIDTLLVFAGLFSAFLTAFVVQTYPMLTEADSSTTNQLLALSVSAQLRMTGIIPPPSVNATLVSLLDAPAFAPTAAARVINIFFFLSLVLSLSSALFGILAKQWIREYLRWNSPLALPRENILVRQARVEEWEAWNVGATISSIPALLESAMVLFLIGIVVLLWTLDGVVAMTITIFASLFLFTAFAFTIMPILQTRCPYKSPTAWACIVMSHASKRLYMAFLKLLRRIRGKTMYGLYPQTAPMTWRELDLRSCKEPAVKFNGREVNRLDLTVAVGRHLPPGSGILSDFEGAECILVNVIETSLLLRALTWVKQSSQDPRIDAYITQCAESIHPNHPSLWAKMTAASNLIANRCILVSLKRQSPRLPYLELFHGSSNTVDCYSETSSELDKAVAAYRLHASFLSQMLSTLPEGATLRDEDCITAQILGRITLADLQYWLKQTEEARNVTVIQELCAILDDLSKWDGEGWYQEALCLTINSTSGISCWGKSESVLRYRTFLKVLCRGRLRATSDHKLIYTAEETTTREDLESLLLDYFIDDPALANGTYLLMFLVTFSKLLEDFMQRHEYADLDPILLDKASWFAAYALSCQSRDIRHKALSLLSRVWDNGKYNQIITVITRTRSPEFRQLIHATERNFSGEFKGYDAFKVGVLHDILELTHKGLPACEEATCRWISHQCHDELPGTCSNFDNLAVHRRAFRRMRVEQEASDRPRVRAFATPARTLRTRMREAGHSAARAGPHSEHTRDSSSTASEAGLESRTTTADYIPLHVIGDAPAEGMEGHAGGETV